MGNATVFLVAGTLISVPTNTVKSVRVGELTDQEQEQWEAISSSELSADVLVLRRPAEKLERIEGIVLQVDTASVRFDFSGQEIDVPVSKLAGFRTFTTREPELTQPTVIVHDIAGNYWPASSVALKADSAESDASGLDVELVCGADVELPLASIQALDFSVGRSKLLSDLPGDYTVDNKGVSWLPNEALVASVLRPRPTFFRPDDSRAELSVIQFPSGGSAKYRLPSGFVKLAGSVMLMKTGTAMVPCNVAIRLNNTVAWESRLTSASTQAEFAVEVQPDQLLELRVVPVGGVPLGGEVQFINVRLSK